MTHSSASSLHLSPEHGRNRAAAHLRVVWDLGVDLADIKDALRAAVEDIEGQIQRRFEAEQLALQFPK